MGRGLKWPGLEAFGLAAAKDSRVVDWLKVRIGLGLAGARYWNGSGLTVGGEIRLRGDLNTQVRGCQRPGFAIGSCFAGRRGANCHGERGPGALVCRSGNLW